MVFVATDSLGFDSSTESSSSSRGIRKKKGGSKVFSEISEARAEAKALQSYTNSSGYSSGISSLVTIT